jgi:hypothetical protein
MHWTDTPIIIESDYLVAIQMITDTEINMSKLAFLVVKHAGQSGRECKFQQICRELNGVSHSLACFGRVKFCNMVWPRSAAQEIGPACNRDDTHILLHKYGTFSAEPVSI